MLRAAADHAGIQVAGLLSLQPRSPVNLNLACPKLEACKFPFLARATSSTSRGTHWHGPGPIFICSGSESSSSSSASGSLFQTNFRSQAGRAPGFHWQLRIQYCLCQWNCHCGCSPMPPLGVNLRMIGTKPYQAVQVGSGICDCHGQPEFSSSRALRISGSGWSLHSG